MNDNNTAKEKMEAALTGLGALAETLRFFYGELLNNGFSEQQAMQMCQCYLKAIATPKNKVDED